MIIKNLYLTNFRNYENEKIEFSPKTNIIYGKNGQGKTNIIEAIYYFQSGKSFRSLRENEIINFGKPYSKIEAEFESGGQTDSSYIFVSDKKSIKLKGVQIEKLSELIGVYSMVIFTPDFLSLIKDGPGERRKFLDSFISQIKPSYFKNLISYYRVLKQRNNLLKSGNKNIAETMDIWEEKLASIGVEICKMREKAIEKINETVNNIGKDDEKTEFIKLKYSPSIKGDYKDKENFKNELFSSRQRDIEKGMTQQGPHRDDFEIFMNDINIKKFGSQGQMRSCVLKLKLSECDIIKEKTGEEPILLLDDILSELDVERRKFFIEKIKDKQVIITCTDKEFAYDGKGSYFSIEDGKATQIF